MNSAYESEYRQLGLRIAYYRKLRGLTQEQLAEKVEFVPGIYRPCRGPKYQEGSITGHAVSDRLCSGCAGI